MERAAPHAEALADRLLLAQIVCQEAHTPPEWAVVAQHMGAHAGVESEWTPAACERVWTQQMQQYVPSSDTARTDRGAQLALAQRLYVARLDELLGEIQAKESAFKALQKRMEDVKSGKLDDELQAALAQRESAQREDEQGADASQREPARQSEPVQAPPDTCEPAPTGSQVEAESAMETEPPTAAAAAPDAVEKTEDDDDAGAEDARESVRSAPDADDLQVEQDLLGESRASTPPMTYSTRTRRSASRAQSQSRAQDAGAASPHTPRSEGASRTESAEPSDAERDKHRRRTMQLLLMLHNQVSNHTHANLFDQPIKEVDAPNYYTFIHHPMDLRLMKQRIKEGAISSSMELRHAFALMYANAIMYNQPGTEVHRMANEMRVATDEILDEFDQTPRG